jgi:predicted enzyme related to lactoylglutathione lyase
MTDSFIAGTVLFAKDMDAMAGFYSAVAGLLENQRGSDFVLLEHGSFELVVHAIPKRIAASIVIARPARRREGTPIKPVFLVHSIGAVRPLVAELGGELNPPGREMRFRGWRACDGHDLEGNVFQLRERAPEKAGA